MCLLGRQEVVCVLLLGEHAADPGLRLGLIQSALRFLGGWGHLAASFSLPFSCPVWPPSASLWWPSSLLSLWCEVSMSLEVSRHCCGEKRKVKEEVNLTWALLFCQKRASAVGPPAGQVLTVRMWLAFLSKFMCLATKRCLCLL